MTSSPTTFIKAETDDFDFNSSKFISGNGFGMTNNFNGQFTTSNGEMGGVNPSDLTMSGGMMNNQFGSQNMSNSFIADDELLGLEGMDDPNSQFSNYHGFSNNNNNNNTNGQPGNGQGFYHNHQGGGINTQIFSNTPDTQPIASPFAGNFNYEQYRPSVPGQQGFSPNMAMQNGGYSMNARIRQSLERQPSDSRSPMTPRTPAMNGLQLTGTPDSGSMQTQAVMQNHLNHNAKMIAAQQWPGSGSPNSWEDDASLPSPQGRMPHPGISEMIKHSSMPAKVENGTLPPPGFQSQEAKKKRRRESHNAVERRRRDNINERIGDLSRLVPQHRLEDEKVRKHINNNGPMSPGIHTSGMSPPQATSLLAGGTGRRAAGNITQGLPMEEKDKGPNKGDILNGAVGWTRDLMWMLYQKYKQESELKTYIESLGGTWPLDSTEDEKRMKTELIDAVEKNGADNFHYTRYNGSGLRVPKHTNYAGDPLSPQQGLSPSVQGGSGASTNQPTQQQFWMHQSGARSNSGSFSLKEEDEYGMDIGT